MTGLVNWKAICEIFNERQTPERMRTIIELYDEKSDAGKVEFLYELYTQEGLFPNIIRDSSGKCASQASDLRKRANVALCSKNAAMAVKLYCECVSFAPVDSEELALAYGNRSIALCGLGRYGLALIDMNRSLKIAACPSFLKEKLLRQKDLCLARIAEGYALNSLCKKLLLSSAQLGTTSGLKEARFIDSDISDANYDWRFPVPPADFKNELLPNTSEKIKLHQTGKYGTHMIATQDIMPGELLMIAKPYASILFPANLYTHCSNCLIRCEILIPCEGCALVMFCGERCRNEALNRFHRLECEILIFLLAVAPYKEELLTLRILSMVTKQGAGLAELMEHPVYMQPFTRTKRDLTAKFDPDDYSNFHNLQHHFEDAWDSVQLERAGMAAYFVHILMKSSLFDDVNKRNGISVVEPRSGLTDAERFVGCLILKFLLTVNCNHHFLSEKASLTEMTSLKDPFVLNTATIGCGVFTLLSLVNHSCEANIFLLPYRNRLVVHSVNPIAAGEQVFTSYGCQYLVESWDERQDYLRNEYYFECDCKPCVENWPKYDYLPRIDMKLTSGKVKLNKLKKSCKRFKMLIAQSEAGAMIAQEFKFLCKHLKLLHDSVQKPWWEHPECAEFIMRTLQVNADNKYSQFDIMC